MIFRGASTVRGGVSRLLEGEAKASSIFGPEENDIPGLNPETATPRSHSKNLYA